MAERKKILYCYFGHSVFGIRDVRQLSEAYDVSVCHYDLHTNIFLKWLYFLRYNLCVIFRMFSVRAVIINFGAWHTVVPVFMARMLGKKSLVIVGGFDVSSIPSLEYGVFLRKGILQTCMRWTYKHATYICPTSPSLKASTNYYADASGNGYKIGLLNYMPELEKKVHVILQQMDTSFWHYEHQARKGHFLAIAYIYHEQTFFVKGFDLIFEAARLLPEYSFTLAGFSPEMHTQYKAIAPPNVTLLGFQSPDEARKLYATHKVFLMPSMTEGLGQTLLEAMLCGCVPVGSNVGAIPYIINDDALILNKKDAKQFAVLILSAFNSTHKPQYWHQKALDFLGNNNQLQQFQTLIGT